MKFEIELSKDKLTQLIRQAREVIERIRAFDELGLDGVYFADLFTEYTLLDAISLDLCPWNEDALIDMLHSDMAVEEIVEEIMHPNLEKLFN